MHLKRFSFLFLAAGLAAALLVGCSPAAQPTLLATVAINTQAAPAATQPVQGTPGSYPGPGDAQAQPTAPAEVGTAYPADSSAPAAPTTDAKAYPGPDAAPAVDNAARVTGTLLEKAVDSTNADFTRLHIRVEAVEDVEGMPNFAKEISGKEQDLFIETARLPELNPNDRFEALVSYNGDEGGGRFNVREIKKLE